MSGNFWTGAAFGALTGVGIGLAAGSNCCHRPYSFGSYTGFGYNNCGFNSYGFGFNNYGLGFSTFGFGFNRPCRMIYGLDAFTSVGVSNRTLARMDLGYYI